MPVSFRDLTGGEAQVDVVYNGHTVKLRYDPSTVTENTVRDVGRELRERYRKRAAEDEGEGLNTLKLAFAQLDEAMMTPDVINALLCRCLLWWDLLDDTGGYFPITEERLGDLPLPFRQATLNTILDEMRLGEQRGTSPKPRSSKRS